MLGVVDSCVSSYESRIMPRTTSDMGQAFRKAGLVSSRTDEMALEPGGSGRNMPRDGVEGGVPRGLNIAPRFVLHFLGNGQNLRMSTNHHVTSHDQQTCLNCLLIFQYHLTANALP
jgi:hypothetical protein